MGTAVFVARNGMHVRQAENGGIEVGKPGYLDYTPPAATFALEEYFQAKHDEELGRWRWPVELDYVVYPFPDGTGCTVLSERTGVSKTYVSRSAIEGSTSYLAPAAAAYFEAHPERKPWHDAKPGEVWVIRTSNVGDERAVQVTPDRTFQYNDAIQFPEAFPLTYDAIESARRIWPEDAS